MILTTTPSIEGHTIREYKSIVFGEVVTEVKFLGAFSSFCDKRESFGDDFIPVREQAMNEMANSARQLGANAVVGIVLDYEVLPLNGMVMVTVSGTAVVVD